MSGSGVGSGVAERLYYDSTELKFRAKVADIRLVANKRGDGGEREQLWQVALDRTAFYPEGGGQPWDTGVLVATARSGAVLEVRVERVEEDEAGEVWHFVRKPLVEGTEVEGRVDAARRMDHTQQHSGQHLLSAVFLARLGARTVSFHLGVDSSTIDLALAAGMSGLAAEEVAAIEASANELVFENRPLRVRWYSRGDAEAMLARGELQKLPDREGPLRVVEMERVEFNACGGTHVVSTGALGGLMVRRLEKVKQGWRVEFVCGLRAVRAARREFGVLSGVAQALSVGWEAVPGRVAALQEENKVAAKQIKSLRQANAKHQAYEMVSGTPKGTLITGRFEEETAEYIRQVALDCANHGYGAVLTAESKDVISVIVVRATEDVFHAGDLVRSVLSARGARGGGSETMGQGTGTRQQMQGVAMALAAEVSPEHRWDSWQSVKHA